MASGKEIQLYSDIGKSQPVYPKTNAKCVFYDDGTRLDRMIAAVAGSRNLLNNSDFTRPVNQRGAASYTGGGKNIDCWSMYANGKMTVSVGDDGIVLDNTADTASAWNIYHRFTAEESKRLGGKVCTIAVCDDSGAILVASGTLDANEITSNTAQFVATSADDRFYINVYKRAVTQCFEMRINVKAAQKVKFKWAAMYEGLYTAETLPEYQPKGYAQELLICNQYDISTDEHIGLRKFGQPHNLLDNSDFRNPVNQNGLALYNGAAGYTIDKWRKDGQTIVEISDGCVIVTANDNGFSHPFPSDILSRLSGKPITMAVKIRSSSSGARVKLGISGGGGYAEYALTGGPETVVRTASFDFKNNPNWLNFVIRPIGEIQVEWAAFYEGVYSADTLPEYQSKGKRVEALNCGAIPGPIDLLWENASPASEFAAQTVAVDLSLYSWCAIETYHSTTEVASTVDFMPVKEGVQYAVDVVDSSDNTARRPFTISKTGIVFDGAKRSGSNTTKYVIPVRIYGVKG